MKSKFRIVMFMRHVELEHCPRIWCKYFSTEEVIPTSLFREEYLRTAGVIKYREEEMTSWM
eukprot:scaffold3792_cov160-Skeletonema_menzelii.AAC.15